jgi:hypothetical protein
MRTPDSDDQRLERLRDLSDQIAAAMAEMLAFQAKVNATLHEIARTRGLERPPAPARRRTSRARRDVGRGGRRTTRRAA